MNKKRKVEIFSAGCAVCDDTINLVSQIACQSCEVEVLDMRQEDVAKQARGYGINTVPAVVIDGKLADCCVNRVLDEKTLRAAGVGVALA